MTTRITLSILLTTWVILIIGQTSAFLTARLALPAASREEGGELPKPGSVAPRASEWLVYAIVLYFAVYLHSGYVPFL